MSLGRPASLTSLATETRFNIFVQGLSIRNLRDLREASKDLRLEVDEFVKNVLIRLNTQGPSMIKNFLAANSAIENEPITSTNAWRILGLFKKAYPSLRTDMSIETACQELEADPAALALRNSFFFPTLRNPANLYLSKNQLTAIDPKTFENLQKLQELYLHENQLE